MSCHVESHHSTVCEWFEEDFQAVFLCLVDFINRMIVDRTELGWGAWITLIYSFSETLYTFCIISYLKQKRKQTFIVEIKCHLIILYLLRIGSSIRTSMWSQRAMEVIKCFWAQTCIRILLKLVDHKLKINWLHLETMTLVFIFFELIIIFECYLQFHCSLTNMFNFLRKTCVFVYQ